MFRQIIRSTSPFIKPSLLGRFHTGDIFPSYTVSDPLSYYTDIHYNTDIHYSKSGYPLDIHICPPFEQAPTFYDLRLTQGISSDIAFKREYHTPSTSIDTTVTFNRRGYHTSSYNCINDYSFHSHNMFSFHDTTKVNFQHLSDEELTAILLKELTVWLINYGELMEWLNKIEINPSVLKEVPCDLQLYSICLFAVTKDITTLKYITNEYSKNYIIKTINCKEHYTDLLKRNTFKEIVLNNPDIVTYELCELAVTQNGLALQYVPEHMITKELCYTAIISAGYKTFKYIPEKFQTPEMCVHMVIGYPENYRGIIKYIKNKDIRMVIRAARNTGLDAKKEGPFDLAKLSKVYNLK